MNEIEEMKTDMLSQITVLFMQLNHEASMETALNEIVNSDTYRKIMNEHTGLYHQSARYVYSFLEEEMKKGKAW